MVPEESACVFLPAQTAAVQHHIFMYVILAPQKCDHPEHVITLVAILINVLVILVCIHVARNVIPAAKIILVTALGVGYFTACEKGVK